MKNLLIPRENNCIIWILEQKIFSVYLRKIWNKNGGPMYVTSPGPQISLHDPWAYAVLNILDGSLSCNLPKLCHQYNCIYYIH